ncbi:SLC13 family permease [Thioalkalivibrio sp. XN279]|uniref:SLC13 family permease n=1 Tax=Thioalkalivibrio sp. XN279 TaxID=2714953 RepID=UPI00140B4115|nr:SLC13 family permease [Thioalkalivibrio sp. XN279]NHA13742.1 SLC13 family permease [Thioalkalivibrio sp. XN279]
METIATLALPDTHGLAVIGLALFALVALTRPAVPQESTSLMVLMLLVLGFEIFPYEGPGGPVSAGIFLSVFGNPGLITILALLVVGRALEVTGAMQPLTRLLLRAWSGPRSLALVVTLLVAMLLSAFLSNTLVVLALLPVLVGASTRLRFPASRVLMPAGFAALLGGMTTTIGTSTNLLVVTEAEALGLPAFGMFSFLAPAAFGAAVGLLFLWLVAPHMLPERDAPIRQAAPRIFKAMFFVGEDSWAVGKTLAELRERTGRRMNVSRVQRGDGLQVAKLPAMRLQAGDRLMVADTREHLKEFERLLGVRMHSEFAGEGDDPGDEAAAEQQLAELVVTPDSPLYGRTLSTTHFRQRFRLLPLAIHRATSTGMSEVTGDFEDAVLQAGDVILVQGAPDRIRELRASGSMLVLDGRMDLPKTSRAPLALGIGLAVVITAAAGWLPISVSATAGAALLIASGCIGWREVAGALSAPLVLMVVMSLALVEASVATGAAAFVADLFLAGFSGLPAAASLALVLLLVAVGGSLAPNVAVALLAVPVAVAVAAGLGVGPEPFVLAVLFGANLSFATAIGSRPNLVVATAGGYLARDFLRVGLPLTVLVWLAVSLALVWRYGIPWGLGGM